MPAVHKSGGGADEGKCWGKQGEENRGESGGGVGRKERK